MLQQYCLDVTVFAKGFWQVCITNGRCSLIGQPAGSLAALQAQRRFLVACGARCMSKEAVFGDHAENTLISTWVQHLI